MVLLLLLKEEEESTEELSLMFVLLAAVDSVAVLSLLGLGDRATRCCLDRLIWSDFSTIRRALFKDFLAFPYS